eukprot:g1294.t1
MTSTPLKDGYIQPAEGEWHERCWMLFPHRGDNWRKYDPQESKVLASREDRANNSSIANALPGQEAYARVAVAISKFEPVTIGFQKTIPELSTTLKGLIDYYKSKDNEERHPIKLLPMSYNDAWIRDTGPTFVKKRRGRDVRAVNWKFNSWGGKEEGCYPDWSLDELVGDEVVIQAKKYDEKEESRTVRPSLHCYRAPFILEGGSFHTNGQGLCVTTEECLLNKNRNPELTKQDLTKYLQTYLGCQHILWLPYGLAGDQDTNGHIDNLLCFAAPRHILLCWTDDKDSPNYTRCRAALKVLLEYHPESYSNDGSNFKEPKEGTSPQEYTEVQERTKDSFLKVTKLHLPSHKDMVYSQLDVDLLDPQEGGSNGEKCRSKGEPLVCSYTNLYMANNGLVMPAFGSKEHDEQAYNTVVEIFKGRKEVIQVNALEIVKGGGGIHCITQQQPSSVTKRKVKVSMQWSSSSNGHQNGQKRKRAGDTETSRGTILGGPNAFGTQMPSVVYQDDWVILRGSVPGSDLNREPWYQICKVDIKSLIGLSYHTKLEVKGKKLVPSEPNDIADEENVKSKEEQSNEKMAIGESSALDSTVSNEKLVDNNQNQSLDEDSIIAMRKKSDLSATELVSKITEGSKTFKTKTVYSQSKYLKKKMRKYAPKIWLLPCNATNLCRAVRSKNAARILHLREDSLARIVAQATYTHNPLYRLDASSAWSCLCVENCAGLLTGAIIARMPENGILFNGYFGQNVNANLINQFNIERIRPEITKGQILHIELKDMLPRIDKAKEEYQQGSKATSTNAASSANANASGSDEAQNTKSTSSADNLRFQAFRSTVIDNGGVSRLVIATHFNAKAVFLRLFPYLRLGSSFVVYSPYLSQVSECKHAVEGKAVMLRVTETWYRKQQIEKDRCHPMMHMESASGYMLTGIKVTPCPRRFF